MSDDDTHGRFDVLALAASLPDTAATMLADHDMTDRPSGSARMFRGYRPVPPHVHRQCDEYLYVQSGRGTFWIGDASSFVARNAGARPPCRTGSWRTWTRRWRPGRRRAAA